MLNGNIKGVYFFSLENGFPEENWDIDNCVIEFEHKGVTKRWWYLNFFINYSNMNLKKETQNYCGFLNTINIDTLMIKAALTWWETLNRPENVVEFALSRARELNSIVITDLNEDGTIRPIWGLEYQPQEVELDFRFGYSRKAHLGEGRYLITPDEVPKPVKAKQLEFQV